MDTSEKLKFYYDRLAELYRLECISALLNWDQRIYMPSGAAAARADQIQYLGLMHHQKSTDPEFIRTVDELASALDTLSEDDQVNVRESKRSLDIARKLPEDFVSEMHQASALSYSAWAKARPENDWAAVEPHLQKTIDLSRKMADLIGYKENPYDALLDQYEPGATTAEIKPLLLEVADHLRVLIPPITEKFQGLEELRGSFSEEIQQKLNLRVAENLGFDLQRGRFDVTPHPFMTTLGPSDFRITTRYHVENFLSALYGTIHETGHALYELGLPSKWAGTPRGSAVSLGFHESQSRFWENLVGRSRAFSSYLWPVVKEFFAQEVASLNEDLLWQHVNRVQPSLVRIDADEVTYSQHIVIRMLLEESLIKGDLKVAELPGAWSDLYEQYLGIRPKDYRNGVLQDVHWYHGSIGYFPTYVLGNLYGAMTMETARAALPTLDEHIAKGEFAPLLSWLRENVHQYGMRFKSRELIRRITGKDLSATPFVEYLKAKFQGI